MMANRHLSFSLDNKKLAALSHKVDIIDISDERILYTFKPKEAILMLDIAYCSDNAVVAISNGNGEVLLWNTSLEQKVSILHKSRVSSINAFVYSPDGSVLAVGNYDGLELWDTKTNKLIKEINSSVRALTYSPDGLFIVTGDVTGSVDVIQSSDGELLSKVQAHTGTITGLGWSSDGRVLITSSRDGTAKLWNITDRSLLHIVQGKAGAITNLSCSKQNNIFAFLNEDATVQVWRF